jgi:NTP pyrophosphatase (non-canonical NTP hydrolase)
MLARTLGGLDADELGAPRPRHPDPPSNGIQTGMHLREFQAQMRALYGVRDRERGAARTFAWFTEECGELSRAVFRGSDVDRLVEFSDVMAWLASLADLVGVDLEEAAERYATGCPRCGSTPCRCDR